jgi:hypothetical protein
MNLPNFEMKIRNRCLLALGFVFLFLSGTAMAQKVTIDFDRNADFSKYKTYSFRKGTPAADPLMNQRIEQAIEAQLAAKGLTRDESNPDLFVVYHVAVSKQTQLNTTSLGGWGWGRGWGRWGGIGGSAITQVDQIPIGHLVVDIGDTANKSYVWRGTATKTISSKPDKNSKSIEEGVRKMFERFPPAPEGKDKKEGRY